MKLEKIAKSIGNIKRTIVRFPLVLLLSASMVMPLNCSSSKTPPPPTTTTTIPTTTEETTTTSTTTTTTEETTTTPTTTTSTTSTTTLPENEAPDTQITKEFKDNGEVEYNLLGTDDCSVDYILANVNGEYYQDFDGDDILVSVPIIQGENTIKAIAYDNQGLEDPTPATDSFISPTEEEAKELIDKILAEKSGTYSKLEKNVKFTLGETYPVFYADYLMTRKSDGKDVVINYVGHVDSLEEELLNKEALDLYGISNLYLVRIPESEINLKLDDFINNDYKEKENER